MCYILGNRLGIPLSRKNKKSAIGERTLYFFIFVRAVTRTDDVQVIKAVNQKTPKKRDRSANRWFRH
jgi:hypothetical protein